MVATAAAEINITFDPAEESAKIKHDAHKSMFLNISSYMNFSKPDTILA